MRLLIALMAILVGCGSSSTPSAPLPSPAAPRAQATSSAAATPPKRHYVHRCALDAPWLSKVDAPPLGSRLMRFDAMRARGGFGPDGPVRTFNEFGAVRRTSEEVYDYPPARPSHPTPQRLVVLREASGPIPSMYDEGRRLASGVVEYTEKTRSDIFGGTDAPATLWVFPDRTWMRTWGEARIARIRAAFATPGRPPPTSTVHESVAWEVCGDLDANDISLPFDRWPLRTKRTALRLYADDPLARLFYDFGDAATAERQRAAQERRCAPDGCAWVVDAQVLGSSLVYDVTLKKTPTHRHTHLEIADTARPLTAIPATEPGVPPSGVYQYFTEVVKDTCPTRAAGKRFPSFHSLYLLRHQGGRTMTKLRSAAPQASFISVQPAQEAELVVGSRVQKELTHLCANYRMKTEVAVLELGANIIKSRTRRAYMGSTKGCRHPNLPSNCEVETVTTWVLRRPVCDAACDATYDGHWSTGSDEPPPRIDASCACPPNR